MSPFRIETTVMTNSNKNSITVPHHSTDGVRTKVQ